MRPISVSFCFSVRLSSDSIGRLMNNRMRLANWLYAVLNAARLASSPPSTPAGSGMPQCAVAGLPGHIGQVSPAALSHTVKMKSISGAPGAANSSQLLLRSPSMLCPCRNSSFSANGLTRPTGWLPALCAMNLPLPSALNSASPRMLRAELPVHSTNTWYFLSCKMLSQKYKPQYSISAKLRHSRAGGNDGLMGYLE